MVRKMVYKSLKTLKNMHSAAKRLMGAGVLFSTCLLVICAVIGIINLAYFFSPFIAAAGMNLTESAVSMFTLSIGCSLLFDYFIKKREIQ